MPSYILPIAILLPILGGALVPVLPFKKNRGMHIYVETLVILTSILVFFILFNPPTETMNLIHFFGDLSIAFKLDGLGSVFTAMVAFLWPFATLYAFEYMKHEGKEKSLSKMRK